MPEQAHRSRTEDRAAASQQCVRPAPVLILTDAVDPHAHHVESRLRQRGAEVHRFDPGQFPVQAAISVSYGTDGRSACTLDVGDRLIDLSAVGSVWYRRPRSPVPHPTLRNASIRMYAADECKRFVADVWESLSCRWVPGRPATIRHAGLKAYGLSAAAALGFELPPTLVTNSPARFRAFYRQHNGNVVSKVASSAFHRAVGETYCRYTEVVSRRDVGYSESIRLAPVIFQAYVPKLLELRVTVVGASVFAAEIHSQATNRTRHDWRRYDLLQTPHRPHELPADLRDRCVRLVAAQGLCYGAIDLILTPDGRYVFVELNPNGQYLWIEEQTGLPITDAICDLLTA
jgi:glutathione synthase/RimK-type ligase-like ATP-grasp enzyme